MRSKEVRGGQWRSGRPPDHQGPPHLHPSSWVRDSVSSNWSGKIREGQRRSRKVKGRKRRSEKGREGLSRSKEVRDQTFGGKNLREESRIMELQVSSSKVKDNFLDIKNKVSLPFGKFAQSELHQL